MENKRSQMKVAMTYGAMYGLSATIIYLIFYFAGAGMQSKWPQYIGYGLLITFLVLGIKSYRDQDLDGYISYGKSLSTGVLIGLFGGIIMGVFTVLMFTVIDPNIATKIMEEAQQKMLDKGLSESQAETALSMSRKFMSPPLLFIFSILGWGFMACIFSLIISVFTKKESSPFDNRPLDSQV